jgi:hypothetical protein
MESKKINQLATEMAPASTDLTIIGDPITGVSKKVTLLQIADIFQTTGTVTSVGVTETGNALTITGSPITSAGNINIGFAGSASQYVRGDGALADFPTSTGGGSSVSYYLNSSVSQGTIGGNAYRQLSKSPVIGAGTDITISANGYVANYITDANDPSLLEVPGGNFNCELYFSVNSNNHNPYVYAELYKYDGTNFTLLGSSQAIPEYLTAGTTLSSYYFAIPVATASLNITDRLAFRIYANVDTRVVTLHTENSHLCQVITTFSNGLTSLNNLTRQVQYFGIGTSGTDFNISSATATHTFNLPTASATNRGALSSTDWTTFNNKQNALTNPVTGTGTSGQVSYFNGTSSITGNNNFFWDTTNSRLGIGLNNPQRVLEIYSATADSHLRLSGSAPTVSMGEAITGSVYQAKFGLVTANGQFYTGAVAGDFVIISQTGSTIWGNSGGERMRLNTNGTVSIGNTNNTFKLDVTGTGRFTGQLTLDSTITNGTYTYTLPSATGTLALTSDLSSYVPTSRTVSTTSPLSGGGALSSDLTLSISQASGSVNGYLSSTDWTTFNSKQGALTLTTTGSSGASTLVSNTLNVPTYTLSGLGGVPTSRTLTINGTTYDLSADRSWTISAGISGSGTTNYVPKFTSGSAIGNSLIFDNGTNVGIGTASPSRLLNISGGGTDGTQLQINGTVDSAGIKLIPTSGDNWEIQANTSNQFFVYNRTDSAYRFLIDGSGNVAIGTTSPTVISNYIAQTINGTSGSFTEYQQGGSYAFRIGSDSSIGGFISQTDANPIRIFTNATERMRITSAGNVGIGTTSPTDKLVVSNAGANTLHFDVEYSGGASTIYSYNRSTSAYTNLQLSASNIIFQSGGTTERMRITSTGNVLIGTTSDPYGNLLALVQSNSASATTLQITNSSNASTTTKTAQVMFNISDTGSSIKNAANIVAIPTGVNVLGADLAFGTRSGDGNPPIERMRITSTGNVGIGTSSPTSGYKLDVKGLVRFGNDGNANVLQMGDLDANSTYIQSVSTAGAAKNLVFYNTGETMRITSTGNVGIGTTAPGHKTVIQTANDTVGLLVTTNANETETGLYIRPDNSTGTIKLFASGNTDKTFAFLTGNTERMRLTSGGDLCINATATSGSAKLYVNGLAVFGSAQVGSLGTGTVYSSSGTLTNTNPSDKRLKENIIPITYGLNEILKLNPVSFDWKNDNNKNKQFGFIAQEVQEVMPEAIIEGEYLGLEKDAIYTALVNAIKELEARLKTLENK